MIEKKFLVTGISSLGIACCVTHLCGYNSNQLSEQQIAYMLKADYCNAVQECDATMFNSITKAGYKIIKNIKNFTAYDIIKLLASSKKYPEYCLN